MRAYEEFFAGYAEDPVALLATTFEKPASYDEMIVLRDIRLSSPIASTTSFPSWVGRISVMCRQAASSEVPSWRALVEMFAKRMQIQEALTSQIADTIQEVLEPRGGRRRH